MEQLTLVLNPEEKMPLYAQLYHAIRRELAQGHIRTGEKLPSKRTLAGSLGISLHTVESAYSQLEAEGYIESRPRSGFYACPVGESGFDPVLPKPSAPAFTPAETDFRYRFSTGGVDTGLFPYATWSRLSKNLMYSHREYLLPGDSRGDAPLRETLCRYLRQTRGVSCHPDQIIVGAGSEYLLCVLSGLLDDCVRFAMENPCYAKTYQILRNCGRTVDLIPLDKDGIDLQALERSDARVVHVTPSHQFPMGMVMPVGRRSQLLQWAQANSAYIIEDDYDSEFRFEGRPIPSLQGMDGAQRTIYLTTFSRSISPSFRLSVLVLPPDLAHLYHSRYSEYSPTVSRYEQHTLLQFIDQSHLDRHLNRVRKLYRAKKEHLSRELRRIPCANLEILGANAGLHLLVRFPGAQETALTREAARAGIRLHGLREFYMQDAASAPDGTLVLGYGALEMEEITAACRILREAWSPILHS